jgi:hypothetical protein
LSTVYGVASGFNILTIAQQNNQWVLQDISTYSFQQASANDPITLKNIYSFDQEYCPGTETTVAGCMQKNLNNEKYFTLLSQHYTNDNPNNQQSAQTRGWIWKEHHGGGGGGGNHHRHYHHR